MKIIDLLNKIANGEEVPELIKYENKRYFWTGLNYYNDKYDEYLDSHICIEDLEQYIEIIEEDKKIEKVNIDFMKEDDTLEDIVHMTTINIGKLTDKINELIDEVNRMEKE